MRDDDARGTWRPSTNAADPHLEFAVKFSEEGGGEDTAQLSPPLAYVFGLDVHGLLSVDILLLVTLRMVLNQTHQRGSKAAKFTTSE